MKKNKFCVLLTASINTNNCIFTTRSDPKIREKDYLDSLKLWLDKTNFQIVFCENSNHNLVKINTLCKKYPGRVEVLQFDGNKYPRHLGKGYGEMQIIKHSMEHSKFIKNSENIIKVTGRIYIKNIMGLLKDFDDNYFVYYLIHRICDKWYHTWTIIFIYKPAFFEYLKKQSKFLDDSKGHIFEDAFKNAVTEAKSDKKKCKYKLMKNSIYAGYSATSDTHYDEVPFSKKITLVILLNLVFHIIIKIKKMFISKLFFLKKTNTHIK